MLSRPDLTVDDRDRVFGIRWTGQMAEPAGRHGTVWVLAVGSREACAISKSLDRPLGRSSATFLLCSHTGRNLIEPGDLVLLSTDRRRSAFRAFSAHARGFRPNETLDLSAVLLDACKEADPPSTSGGGGEAILLRLASATRFKRHVSRGGTAIERALDSLLCRDVVENGYLRGRIAEHALQVGAGRSVLAATLNRLSADAFAMTANGGADERRGRLREAVKRYQLAEAYFVASGLSEQAMRCEQRRRRASDDANETLQYLLPGFSPRSIDSLAKKGTIGFSALRCIAIPIRCKAPVGATKGRDKGLVSFLNLGEIVLPPQRMAKLTMGALERPDLPSIEPMNVRSREGRLSFDLNVRVRPAAASLSGETDRIRRDGTRSGRAYVLARGRDCVLLGPARRAGPDDRVVLPMQADRAGYHKIELVVTRGSGSSKHVVTVDLRRSTEWA